MTALRIDARKMSARRYVRSALALAVAAGCGGPGRASVRQPGSYGIHRRIDQHPGGGAS